VQLVVNICDAAALNCVAQLNAAAGCYLENNIHTKQYTRTRIDWGSVRYHPGSDDNVVQTVDIVCRKKRKEKTTPFIVNLMRSQVLYQAVHTLYVLIESLSMDLGYSLCHKFFTG